MSEHHEPGPDAFAGMRSTGSAGYFAPFAESQLSRPLIDTLTLSQTWQRPGLSSREHFLAHIAMMAVLNRPHEFREHLRGALAAGVTPEQVVDVLCHVKAYAGMPAAVDATMLPLDVLADDERAAADG